MKTRPFPETRVKHGMPRGPWHIAPLTLALWLGACGVNEPVDPPPVEAPRCEASPVRCAERSIDQLNLLTTVSTGEIREEGTVAGEFQTYVDARAGGASATQSYTYGRFTPQGLSRVAVDDQAALASTDWDIALRRYTIRVNSGVSGPSCVAVARTPAGTSFESVTAVDAAWGFSTEDYFTESCEAIPGQYGLGLATRLEDFWGYEACLSMTGAVFVLRLADGRHVKLQVMHYYDPEPQRVCDETGEVPQPSGAAQLRIRWAFLP
ncbi:hypothetical protein D187_006221 [Cystobacter fuscus DSM 2262]|uniref:Lipoprotein n=1 Tax=Cystobacter fuscus (strain ATCC 25194 / DSM 2262 / NBRC 100088 / M29) TaxID=1242864 RepID=S9PIA1_CYSF2|nr:HmuY family protein [Cystobacter fuscus]EPX62811.1 hypothetical protein D187_006221 [Cystobacter fuscus DSM 2262]